MGAGSSPNGQGNSPGVARGRQASTAGGLSDSSSRYPPAAGQWSSAAFIRSTQSSATMSSASQNRRSWPRATPAATASAPARPTASRELTMRSGTRAPAARMARMLSSVDPLSLKMISQRP